MLTVLLKKNNNSPRYLPIMFKLWPKAHLLFVRPRRQVYVRLNNVYITSTWQFKSVSFYKKTSKPIIIIKQFKMQIYTIVKKQTYLSYDHDRFVRQVRMSVSFVILFIYHAERQKESCDISVKGEKVMLQS